MTGCSAIDGVDIHQRYQSTHGPGISHDHILARSVFDYYEYLGTLRGEGAKRLFLMIGVRDGA